MKVNSLKNELTFFISIRHSILNAKTTNQTKICKTKSLNYSSFFFYTVPQSIPIHADILAVLLTQINMHHWLFMAPS